MNILSALFGIFRQRGLVNIIKEDRSLVRFSLSALLFSIIAGLLYGFAMGVGIGIETAVKDAIKVGLIITFGFFLSTPIFWVAYRLLGREERLAQVAVVPLTLLTTMAIIMAATAPIVLMLSVLVGFSPEAVYIHIVILNIAVLVGLYLAGTLIYQSFSNHKQLVIPNVVGFLMMGVILVVLMSFLGPFLSPSSTFSVGTNRLKDRLGIGVAEKVSHALAAAKSADRVSYRFQTTNDNGDLTRDYSVTRVGNDYIFEVHLHALPEEVFREDQRVWVLDGQYYTDYENGQVALTTPEELASLLDYALPKSAFILPLDLTAISWRAYEKSGLYTATGTNRTLEQVILVLDFSTGRLSGLTIGSAERGVHAEVRVIDILPSSVDRSELEASLNQRQ